jgi:CHAT domain-containing protein
VLAYVRLPEGLALWSLDDRGAIFHQLNVTAAQLAPVAERFARQCADPRSQADARQRDAAKLYQWLLAPVAARLDPARTLVIESDEVLGAVPWRALLDDRFALVAGRGLAAYTERAGRDLAITPAQSLLVMADPTLPRSLRASFPALPHALAEAEFVRTLFRPAMLIAQDAATAAALREYRTRGEIFHFAGHGTPQGLLLASGTGRAELLRAESITGQDWSRCRLVFLSACSSGTGERYGLVNPESLVRSFLNAGAGRVLATSWNADSASAAQLAQSFYSAVLSGGEPADALRQAARTLRRNAATAHPYYWAGYQLFGYK